MSDPPKFTFVGASSGGGGGAMFGSSTSGSGGSSNPFAATTGAPSTAGGGLLGSTSATSGSNTHNQSSVFSGGSSLFSSSTRQPVSTGFNFGQRGESDSKPGSTPTTGLFTPNKTSAPSNAGQTQTSGFFGAVSNPTPVTSGPFSVIGSNTSNTPSGSTTPASSKPFGEVMFGQNPSTTPAGPPPSGANTSAASTSVGLGAVGLFGKPPQQQQSNPFGAQGNTSASIKAQGMFSLGNNQTSNQQTPATSAPTLTLFGGTSHATGGLFSGQKVNTPTSAPGQAPTGLFQAAGGSSLFSNPSNKGPALQSPNANPFSGFILPTSTAAASTPAASGLSGQKPLGFASPINTQSQTPNKPMFPSMGSGTPSMPTAQKPALSFSPTPAQPPAASTATSTAGSPFNFAPATSVSSAPAATSTASSPTMNLFASVGKPSGVATTTSGATPASDAPIGPTATTSASALSPFKTTSTTSSSALAPSLFKAATATSSPAPTPNPFGVATATSSSVPAPNIFGAITSAAPSSTPASSPFGATATAASSSAPVSKGITETAATAPPTTAAPAAGALGGSTSGPAPAPQSRLKNKTMEEILTRWASDLSKYQKEFQNQADKVAGWDKMLVENGKKISDLYNATFDAERQSAEVERQLSQVEGQQEELSGWLDKYEREVDELYTRQVGHGDTLQGPDQERERTYKLAEKLNDRLEDMGKDLTSMIEEINNASSSLNKSSKPDDPLSQIVKVLNSHLSQLQWIDQNAATLQSKVSAAQKAGQGIGSNGYGGPGEEAADDFYRSFRGRR
ncbi:MAG: Nucleoporin-62 C-terminal-like protein [Geoglossum simile]|nr:MAG: Nucleoporin-62 C-terminal-like protein [Geoglossum simile]